MERVNASDGGCWRGSFCRVSASIVSEPGRGECCGYVEVVFSIKRCLIRLAVRKGMVVLRVHGPIYFRSADWAGATRHGAAPLVLE